MASDGEIGKCEELYFDDETWTVRYLVVRTGGWIAGHKVLISPESLAEIDLQSGVIAVKLTREQVRNSPPIDEHRPVSAQYRAALHRHYGWSPYWTTMGISGGMMLPPVSLVPFPVEDENVESTGGEVASHLRSSAELRSGYTLHAQDGEIGRVMDFIIDDKTWEVRYFVVHTGVWFLGKDILLSPQWIQGISCKDAEVMVNLPRFTIKDAPGFDAAMPLSRSYEQRLHDHYGRNGYWSAVTAAESD